MQCFSKLMRMKIKIRYNKTLAPKAAKQNAEMQSARFTLHAKKVKAKIITRKILAKILVRKRIPTALATTTHIHT